MTAKKFSYTNILSPEIVQTCLQVREDLSSTKWLIGDMVLKIAEMHALAMNGFQARDVCKAMAAFIGVRAVEVIEMARMSKKFPQEVRDQRPTLSWGYFQRAYLFGKESDQVLDWAEAQTDELNRPASLDAVTVVMSAPDPSKATTLPIEEAKRNTRKKSVKALRYVESRIQTGAIDMDADTSRKSLGLVAFLVKTIEPQEEKK